MSGYTDQVVLNSWNGRPTLTITVIDDAPHMHWLVEGHVEDRDVWLEMQLTWAEANHLIDSGPLYLDKWVAERPGRAHMNAAPPPRLETA